MYIPEFAKVWTVVSRVPLRTMRTAFPKELWRFVSGKCYNKSLTSIETIIYHVDDHSEGDHTSNADTRDHFTGVCFDANNNGTSVHFEIKK